MYQASRSIQTKYSIENVIACQLQERKDDRCQYSFCLDKNTYKVILSLWQSKY